MSKKKILIFGTGKTATKVCKLIDLSKANIVACLDNYYTEKYWNGFVVLNPNDLVKDSIEFDYILIASVFSNQIMMQLKEIGISSEKVIRVITDKKGGNLLLDYTYLINNPFQKRYNEVISQMKEPKLLITGISYHNGGIDSITFDCEAYNLAIRGQDLFYDYTVVKHLMDNYGDKTSHIKHVIVGLSYYSFEYDFSKSSSYIEALRYYPIIKEPHNLCHVSVLETVYNEINREMKKYKGVYECIKKGKSYYSINEEEGKSVAESDSNKMFPITRCENKSILTNYLSLLLNRGITPIIVIMPVTQYYSKYFSESLIKEFYDDLYEVIGNNKIQILDYFDKMDYPDEYFYHVSHLNKIGCRAFTKQLIDDINWNDCN